MQPYFFPYLGYFQLVGAVDVFVVYDDIKYTKKGWINRNRMLRDGKIATFSLPLKHGSDFLDVRDRELAADFDPGSLLARIREAYRRAPHFGEAFALIERILRHRDRNLFGFLHNSIVETSRYLGIDTEIRKSSDVSIAPGLKHQDRIIATCESLGARQYVNAIGGVDLYSRPDFRDRGIELNFLQSRPFAYAQFDHEFVPNLSILDAMMFNSAAVLGERVASGYELI